MSSQLYTIVEAPSLISYSPVTQYPLLYSSHAYSSKPMVQRPFCSFQTRWHILDHVSRANPTMQQIQTACWLWSLACTSLPQQGQVIVWERAPYRGPQLYQRPFLQSQSKDHLKPASRITAWHCLIY